jgi:hypothetical protein
VITKVETNWLFSGRKTWYKVDLPNGGFAMTESPETAAEVLELMIEL